MWATIKAWTKVLHKVRKESARSDDFTCGTTSCHAGTTSYCSSNGSSGQCIPHQPIGKGL